MRNTFLLAGVVVSLFAFNANALDFQQYVSVKATYSDMNNTVKDHKTYHVVEPGKVSGTYKTSLDDEVFGGSFAYGVKMNAVRTELELNLHQEAKKTIHEVDGNAKIKIKNNSAFLNAYYDIDTGTKFTPYIGGGLGVARIKVSGTKSSDEFAWQLGAGVSYAATENISVDLGYRYIDYGSHTINREVTARKTSKTDFESDSNEFYLGVRYAF
ncbi:MAG: porin family protein [Alphaproteobacteria bacterium]|nr:porin family protein [Alphaproteobacteria bacterium]